jgi:2-polyprenyl-6-hydroxyphenyl methylase/3-demethylubiquinone-9 3-methyltransferase
LYPKIYLKNINDWLKNKGYLILTTPYHGYFKNLLITVLNKFDHHVNPLWEGGHIKFFSKRTISKLLNQTGFKLMNFIGCGRIFYIWKSMIFLAMKNTNYIL